jgi:hypothetical protein
MIRVFAAALAAIALCPIALAQAPVIGQGGAVAQPPIINRAPHPGISGPGPTATACGTGPIVTGSDFAGWVTPGTGSPTSCVLTWAAPFQATPVCSLDQSGTTIVFVITATGINLTTIGSIQPIYWICFANPQ